MIQLTDFHASSEVFTPLRIVASTGSTNADVLADIDVPGTWPHFSALTCLDQRSGRGRLGRRWLADPGAVLAISIVLRPQEHGIGRAEFGRIPLVAGLAVRDAITEIVDDSVALKWPNDVRIGGAKVAGILCEASAGGAVVVGIGVNLADSRLAFEASALEPAIATSLAAHRRGRADARPMPPDRVLELIGLALRRRFATFIGSGGELSSLGPEYRVACETIGRGVRLEVPGSVVRGICVDVDEDGRLVIDTPAGRQAFTAGDVTHVR